MKNEKDASNNTFLIIGAGPAGLLAGIELSKLGFGIQIIERHAKQIRPVCGEYLTPQGKDLLLKLGLSSTLVGFDQINGMTLYSPSQVKVVTTFPGNSSGVAIDRNLFQERLASEFIKLGGVIHYGHELEFIKDNDGQYEVKTNSGNFTSKYLLGADGRQSKTAKLLDMKIVAPTEKKIAIHCYLTPKKSIGKNGQMHILGEGSYIGINPISDVLVNFSIVTDANAIKNAGGMKELLNFWLEQNLSLKEQFNLITDEEIKTASPLNRNAIDIAKGNCALIGDASGFIDPLTGEGITTAIKTVSLLTNLIREQHNVIKAFEIYGLRRKKDFSEKEKLNKAFQQIIKLPVPCEVIAHFLNISTHIRDTFIGVIGNIYSPKEGLLALLTQKRF